MIFNIEINFIKANEIWDIGILKAPKKIIVFLCYGFEKSFINIYFYLKDFGS